MKIANLASLCLGFFFPSSCALCGIPASSTRELLLGVCPECAAGLAPEGGPWCATCGKPLVSETGLCTECRELPPPAHSAARALFPYGGAPGKLLRAYKFGPHRNAAGILAEGFDRALSGVERDLDLDLTVVPVPPRPRKLKALGWDQVEEVVRVLEGRHRRRVARCLRSRSRVVQKRLGREGRAANAGRAYECAGPPPSAAVVIDDVITTGATLAACSRVLKEAGSRTIVVLAYCYD